jgi:hypothetical protein
MNTTTDWVSVIPTIVLIFTLIVTAVQTYLLRRQTSIMTQQTSILSDQIEDEYDWKNLTCQ